MTTPPSATEPVALADHTTLRLGGPAARFVNATTAAELVEVVRAADAAREPLLVLGGGSNLVIADSGFDGAVVRIGTSGRRIDRLSDGRVQLTVEAGEDWDEVVAHTVANDLGGLECLSGIPGLVGATPVQNVGAYGVEITDVLVSVDLLDRESGQVRMVPAAELGLAYRTSVLKGKDNAVVLRARFALTDGGKSAPIAYAELARTLGVQVGDRAPVRDVRDTVLELRRGKGMVLDPVDNDTWSAGSFFTNPIIGEGDEVLSVLERASARAGGGPVTMPTYPAGEGRVKLSAAWLIERAGFHKGYSARDGRVSLSTKHTLALTNRGSASTEDLLALAAEVRDGVDAAFGVRLHPEPVLVGCAL
ncbi:UDP-N-acetylmuramate dehydrogenase [Allokutzneria albata]|uniref:UDP-N-acetylenolpyruvoylglucosamine reductase n=1 Tax=Allokutzneria albata TaxID=211114 RepID=A0A1G9Z739_ALLAB|nr:UDP-N-acetylmuramate dehydrogenase [Allokutzneria albata]SDN16875.1 UDP-N-acetylmuramate dehydrogenase [Allokutzneria albata]